MNKSIEELLKPRTIFALMVYSVFCFMAVKGKVEPNIVENMMYIMIAFYYGEKSGKKGGTNAT